MNKDDGVWAEIYNEYNKMVDDGELDPKDRRDESGLRTKFSKESKMFKDHVTVLKRAMNHSGAAAEDCHAFLTVTTPIFFQFNYHERPSIDLGAVVNSDVLQEQEEAGAFTDNCGPLDYASGIEFATLQASVVAVDSGAHDEPLGSNGAVFEEIPHSGNPAPDLEGCEDAEEESSAVQRLASRASSAGPSRIGGCIDPKYRPAKKKRMAHREAVDVLETLREVSCVLSSLQQKLEREEQAAELAARRAKCLSRRAKRHDYNMIRLLLSKPTENDTTSESGSQ